MPEVKIYHTKFGHSGKKHKEGMTVLVIWGKAWGEGEVGLRKKVIKGGGN